MKRHVKDPESAYEFLKSHYFLLDDLTFNILLEQIKFDHVYCRYCLKYLPLSKKHRNYVLEKIVENHNPATLFSSFDWEQKTSSLNINELSDNEKRIIMQRAIETLNENWLDFILTNNFFTKENEMMQRVESALVMKKMIPPEKMFFGFDPGVRIKFLDTFQPVFYDHINLITLKSKGGTK